MKIRGFELPHGFFQLGEFAVYSAAVGAVHGVELLQIHRLIDDVGIQLHDFLVYIDQCPGSFIRICLVFHAFEQSIQLCDNGEELLHGHHALLGGLIAAVDFELWRALVLSRRLALQPDTADQKQRGERTENRLSQRHRYEERIRISLALYYIEAIPWCQTLFSRMKRVSAGAPVLAQQQCTLPLHQLSEPGVLVCGDGFQLSARGNERGFEVELFRNRIAQG